MAFSFGNIFDAIGNNIGKIGTAIAGGVGAWASIKSRKQSIALQQAQIQAEIAKINAQKNISIAVSRAQAANQAIHVSTMPIVGQSPTRFSFSSIPPWMLVAGALGALFMMRGAVK